MHVLYTCKRSCATVIRLFASRPWQIVLPNRDTDESILDDQPEGTVPHGETVHDAH